MKKCGKACLLVWMVMIVLTGCTGEEKEKGRSEVSFTVVSPDEIPEELAAEIESNKQGEIRMTWTDGDEMYLIRGYGEQKTGGYSISVVECSEDETSVYLDTRLQGPSNQAQLSREPSWPYLVLKMDARDKEAVIQ